MSEQEKTMTPSKESRKSGDAKSSDRLRAGSNTLVSVIGAAVILAAVNYLGMRHYVRADWTAAGLYTLSDKSLKVLGELDRPTTMYMLWSTGDPSGRFEEAKEILDRYAAASPRLSVEVVDWDLNPEKVKMLIDRYGAKTRQDIFGQTVEQGILVVSGDNVKFVSSTDFDSFGGGFGGPPESEEGLSGYKAEQSLTSAVIQVTSDDQTQICFSQGHGEWSFEDQGGRSLGHVKDELVQDGYKVEAITTAGSKRIPSACDAVVVVGPERAFLEEEADQLERYLKGGGKLLLLLDPLVDETRFKETGLEAFTAKYGIKLSKDIVVEYDSQSLASDVQFLASEFTSHDAVRHLIVPDSVGQAVKAEIKAYPVLFSIARTLEPRKDADVVAEPLAKTSDASWGEVDRSTFGASETAPAKDQFDVPGPTTIAMAASLPTKDKAEDGGRMIVVGDADFLEQDFFLNAGLYNRDFFAGLLGWLTRRGDLISIAPKNPEHVRLNLTEEDVSTIRNLIWGEVLFFVILGVVVWIRRRS
jgi:ABC-2 type transport system permease protein